MKRAKRILFILILVIGFGVEMMVLAPKRLRVSFESFSSKQLPASFEGVRIGLISDIYDDLDVFKSVVKLIEQQAPDLVIISGFNLSESVTQEKFLPLLKQIQAPLGVYAVDSFERIKGSNVIPIEATRKVSNHTSEAISLTNGPHGDSKAFTIQIDTSPHTDNQGALRLAGGTLGGHINIPFFGSLVHRPSPHDSKTIFSDGIGTPNPEFRLFSHPTLKIITLKK